MKQYYLIYNDTNKTTYTKKFESSNDARQWVINHLDLSLNWSYDTLEYLLDNGFITEIKVA